MIESNINITSIELQILNSIQSTIYYTIPHVPSWLSERFNHIANLMENIKAQSKYMETEMFYFYNDENFERFYIESCGFWSSSWKKTKWLLVTRECTESLKMSVLSFDLLFTWISIPNVFHALYENLCFHKFQSHTHTSWGNSLIQFHFR